MNWKRALLVAVLLGFAFVLLVVATIGVAVTTAVVAVAESGVVQPIIDAVSDVAEGAERLQFEVSDSEFTVTNLDNGRSRVIFSEPSFRGERVEITVPRITITDPDSGQVEVVVPDLPDRLPRLVFENEDRLVYWNDYTPAPLGFFFRGLTTLMALTLVAIGVWLLLKNRRAKEKAESI